MALAMRKFRMVRRPAAGLLARKTSRGTRYLVVGCGMMRTQAFVIPFQCARRGGERNGSVHKWITRIESRRSAHLVGKRPIGQCLGQMHAADLVGAVEIRQ